MFIPKFSISTSYDLENILPKMGIRDAFGKHADFSGITKTDSLRVSKVGWSLRISAREPELEGAVETDQSHALTSLSGKQGPRGGEVMSLSQKWGRIARLPSLTL